MEVKTELETRNELVTDNLYYVQWLVFKYYAYVDKGLHDDLISVGYLAMLEAARSYKPELGKFTTYAHSPIKWGIINYLKKHRKEQLQHNFTDELCFIPHTTEDRTAVTREYERLGVILEERLPGKVKEVYQLRMKGIPCYEIAERLSISLVTVSNYMQRMRIFAQELVNGC